MKRISVSGLAKRRWIPLVAVVVVALAAFFVYRVHGIFGSHNQTSGGNDVSNEIVPFNPKHVILEVFGAPGTVASISYQDVNAQPQEAVNVTLPWKYEITTTLTAVIATVAAQGNGNSIGCRITINGDVKDERTVDEVNAYTFCLDKSG